MRAVGYQSSLPIEDRDSLQDIDLPDPVPEGHDLLVRVEAVSVNPVDTKVRRREAAPGGGWKVLGYDAAGTVIATGESVKRFAPGDHVFYAGALNRPGTNSVLHLVDERIAGRKPRSLSFAEAAAIPLTAITAWEMLFDRLDVRKPVPGVPPCVLIVGGAGGVGSIAIQLLRALTDATVIATASRPETREWALGLGAHHVIDHRRPLSAELETLGFLTPGFVFCTTNTGEHVKEVAALIAPQGRVGVIDDPPVLDILPFKRKSVSVHWEFMFTRPVFGTADIGAQGALLDEVSALLDAGKLRSTLGEHFGAINAENLRRAHALLESGTARGKIVLSGFD
jgi:zinc-binding alcohol dehydrogenase family protein